MDPEVVSDRPGPCPKCGMALEPRIADLSDAPNPELVDMSRRFWIGVVLGAPVFLLTMGDMVSGGTLSHRIGMSAVNWLGLVLATPVVFWCGWPFFHRMWNSIVNASPNMFTLIGLGVGTAYVYSAAVVVTGGMETSFDTAVVIVVLVLLGQVLELRARQQTGTAIRQLLGLAPKTARRVRNGARRGRSARRRPGGRSPARPSGRQGSRGRRRRRRAGGGRRIDGDRRVDARGQGAGDRVIGATIAVNGSVTMRAERVGRDTLLAQIVRMVGDAQRTRAPIQRLADRVAGYFVPAVVAVRRPDLHRLGARRSAAAGRARPRQRRRGADHRVSLRARAGDADGDHGGHRPRRECRRADPERRCARASRAGRHAGRGQDGNVDRGPPAA